MLPDAQVTASTAAAERIRSGSARAEIEQEGAEVLLAHRAIERLHVEQAVDPPADVRLGPWLGVCRPGPGHTDDGMVVSLPDEHLLVAGDYLSSLEIPAAHASVHDYRATLQMLISVIERERPLYVVVGHGKPHTSEEAMRIADEDLDYIEAVLRYADAGCRPARPSRSRCRTGRPARPTGPCTRPTSPARARRRARLRLRVEHRPRTADNESMVRALRTILHVRRHPLGPRVYIAGFRVHECWAGLVAVIVIALAGSPTGRARTRSTPPCGVVAVWMMAKDWPDFFPSRRDTYSWRMGSTAATPSPCPSPCALGRRDLGGRASVRSWSRSSSPST